MVEGVRPPGPQGVIDRPFEAPYVNLGHEQEIPDEKLGFVGPMAAMCALGNDENEVWDTLINTDYDGVQQVVFPGYEHSRVTLAAPLRPFDLEAAILDRPQGPLFAPGDYDFYHPSALAGLHAVSQVLEPFSIYEPVEVNGETLMLPRINPEIFDPKRVAVVAALEMGGMVDEAIKTHETLKRGKRVGETSVIQALPDTLPSAVTRIWGLKGESSYKGSACSSAISAMGEARRMILVPQSDVDAVLVLGAELPVGPIPRAQFEGAKALSRKTEPKMAPRPFDIQDPDDGFVIGNAIFAFLIVRGAVIKAKGLQPQVRAWYIAHKGYGEAYSMTEPNPNGEGTYEVVTGLLDKTVGGKPVRDIVKKTQFGVSAHGTGTLVGDQTEGIGLDRAVEDEGLWQNYNNVQSTKAKTGHSLTTMGGVEVVFCVKELETHVAPANSKMVRGRIPAMRRQPLTENEPRPSKAEVKIKVANGFGGTNQGVVILAKESTAA